MPTPDPGVRVLFTPDAFVQPAGGVSRYFTRLHEELRRLGVHATIVAGLHWNGYVSPGNGTVGLRLPSWSRRRWALGPVHAANQAATRLASRARPEAVLHPTYYTAPLPKGAGPVVLTVYDMIHELFPGTLPASEGSVAAAKRRWCRRATAIIALSERTKADLAGLYDIDPDRISVVYPGVDPRPEAVSAAPWPRPYLLYVGSRRAYKNFEPFLRSFAGTRASRELDLVVFGGERLNDEERAASERRGIRLHRSTGSDAFLGAHYQHARALVYPSLYEGFGFPPLEAMTYRCPVACSWSGSLTEVVGDAATLFDPCDLHAMAAAVDRVCFDETLRSGLQEHGQLRVARYRWSDTARNTLAVYATAAKGKPLPSVWRR